jgi:hypothetical protein
MAEFGLIAAQGKGSFIRLAASLDEQVGAALPTCTRSALQLVVAQFDDAGEKHGLGRNAHLRGPDGLKKTRADRFLARVCPQHQARWA